MRQNQAVARETKTKVLEDALPDLRASCGHLQDIVDSCKNRTSASASDITHCSMVSRTEAVFITLIKGMEFLIDYFKHIRHEELLRHIMVKMLNDSLAEAFFGHITEMISANNLTFLQMERLLASEEFHYLLIVLSSSDNLGVTVRRTRDEHAGTHFYNSIDDCSGENAKSLLWLFFNARHESLFTTEQLRRTKKNNHNSENMLFIGRLEKCESFLKMRSLQQETVEGKAVLRAVTMATKSRKMKTLRDFQKRGCGTAPTIIGQHLHRTQMNIPSLDTRILQNCNVMLGMIENCLNTQLMILMILQNIFSSKVKLQSSKGQMDFHLTCLRYPETMGITSLLEPNFRATFGRV